MTQEYDPTAEPERYLANGDRKAAYAVMRSIDDRETARDWLAWINRQDDPSEYRWAAKFIHENKGEWE